MKTLKEYLLEEKDDITASTSRGDIKFTIWKAPDRKVKWLNDNEKYQKIEYKLEDKEEGLYIDFLLGFKDGSWKLWIGKIGSCSYDDDPYCSFETKKFEEGIVCALDKVEEFVKKVKDDPDSYIQFYKTL
jgi:hypothetical protein